ncbi:prostasin-like [Xyrauchen texanus]|uniref:prostasin-like n=1 Tax=Xyrauchen texanus TaxID=154827 RepID=UPI0022427171|nr:prostasin-like [Xyrauchen texanus]
MSPRLLFTSHTTSTPMSMTSLCCTYTYYIRPMCLEAKNSSFPSGTIIWITGWVDVASGVSLPTPGTLQDTIVPVVHNMQYNNLLGAVSVTNNIICAGLLEAGKITCQGDSGGAAVFSVGSVWYHQLGLWPC